MAIYFIFTLFLALVVLAENVTSVWMLCNTASCRLSAHELNVLYQVFWLSWEGRDSIQVEQKHISHLFKKTQPLKLWIKWTYPKDIALQNRLSQIKCMWKQRLYCKALPVIHSMSGNREKVSIVPKIGEKSDIAFFLFFQLLQTWDPQNYH